MLLKPPRILKRNKKSSPSKPANTSEQDRAISSSNLVNVDSLPVVRRPYDTQDLDIQPERLLYGPGGPFTQPFDPSNPRSSTLRAHGMLSDTENPGLVNTINIANIAAITDVSGLNRLRSQRRKVDSYRKWTDEIIPSLVVPYLSLLKHTASLKLPPNVTLLAEVQPCDYDHPRRQINVTCVYLDSVCYNFFDIRCV
jgi:hypothetical protein